MGRVVHFEIHAANPERAAKFYTDVFGWEIKNWEGPIEYWLIDTSDKSPNADNTGIDGAILRRVGDNPDVGEATPVVGYVCTIGVVDMDSTTEKILAAGGTEVMAKAPIPGIGWNAYFKDTESNIFGVLQPDASVGMPAEPAQ